MLDKQPDQRYEEWVLCPDVLSRRVWHSGWARWTISVIQWPLQFSCCLSQSVGEGGSVSGVSRVGTGREGARCSLFLTQGYLLHDLLHDFCYSMDSLGLHSHEVFPYLPFPFALQLKLWASVWRCSFRASHLFGFRNQNATNRIPGFLASSRAPNIFR